MVEKQFGLFYEPVPQTARKTDPETSKQAAKKIDANSIRHRILSVLAHYPQGLATFELAIQMATPRDYISPHLKPLERGGWVRKTGETKVNPRSKQNKVESEIWQVTEKFLGGTLRPIEKSQLRRDAIIMCQNQIKELENNIDTILQMACDFNPLRHKLKNVKCKDSPIQFCIIDINTFPYDGFRCIFCQREYRRKEYVTRDYI